jgi:hypothetical protein
MDTERRLFEDRQSEKRRQGQARTLLFDVGWRAPRPDLETAAALRHPQMALPEREQLVARAMELQEEGQKMEDTSAPVTEVSNLPIEQPEEAPKPKPRGRNGPKLTKEEREQVRAVIRRELHEDAAVSAAAVQRTVAAELGITFNHTTFHSIYWRKAKSQMETEAPNGKQRVNGSSAKPLLLPPEQPAKAVLAAPREHLTLTPGPGDQWSVRMDLQVPREVALRIVQEVAKLLAAD